MILPIYTYGQQALRKVSVDIDAEYPNLKELIANMFETLTASDGVGLAAPQIGKDIRLAVIDLDVLAEEYPEYKDFRKAYINTSWNMMTARWSRWKRAASRCPASTNR